jgi:Ca2+-binding RTX toxin-like protein
MKIKLGITSLIAIVALGAASLAAAAVITGTDGDDTLMGTPHADLIQGLGGNDMVAGRGGGDIILAGPGNDLVRGGDGSDTIWGNAGDDVLHGGNGADIVRGRSGDDQVYGGDGPDQLFAGFGADKVFGGPGDDHLYAVAKDGQLDKLNCGPGNDVATIRAGEPTAVVNCEKVEVAPDNPSSTNEPGESSTSEGP